MSPENSGTAPSGSSSKAAAADAKKRREKKENLQSLIQERKNIIANTELCVTEAIRTEQNSSSQTTPADSETDPLRWMLHKVSSP